jgi:hypothetical protein
MKLQSGFKLVLASAVAVCFVLPAYAGNSHGRSDRDDSDKRDRDDSVKVVSSVKAPEIDPTSAISALTLLMGGLAVIHARKPVKLQPE